MIAQFGDRILQFRFQILKPPRVFEHRATGIGEHHIARGTVEQLLSEFAFEALQRQRNRRLRTPKLLRRARETSLVRDRHEDPECVQLHALIIFYNSSGGCNNFALSLIGRQRLDFRRLHERRSFRFGRLLHPRRNRSALPNRSPVNVFHQQMGEFAVTPQAV